MERPGAVAQAAMDSGVATRPLSDLKTYQDQLSKFVFRTGMAMRPIFGRAQADPRPVVYAEGEEERVLRAVQNVIDDGLARPIVLGRRERVTNRISKLGLRMQVDQDFQLIDPLNNPYYEQCWREYHRLLERQGIDPNLARIRVNTRTTVLGAMLVRLGYAEVMLCGTIGRYHRHLSHVMEILGPGEKTKTLAALNMVITSKHTLFLCDTHVNPDPNAEEIADMTLMAAEWVRRFGIVPKVALVSHANFGSRKSPQARKMADALEMIRQRAPALEAEGEMQADLALLEPLRSRLFPNSQLKGVANLLIMPNLDAANIAFNLLKTVTDGVAVGPILMGLDMPAHVMTKASTVRRIVNMSAIAVVDAQGSAPATGHPPVKHPTLDEI
jgi:malate dehydrogenase (oxaloacetate-decarboxylating)(NADP+)